MTTYVIKWRYNDDTKVYEDTERGWNLDDALERFAPGKGEIIVSVYPI